MFSRYIKSSAGLLVGFAGSTYIAWGFSVDDRTEPFNVFGALIGTRQTNPLLLLAETGIFHDYSRFSTSRVA